MNVVPAREKPVRYSHKRLICFAHNDNEHLVLIFAFNFKMSGEDKKKWSKGIDVGGGGYICFCFLKRWWKMWCINSASQLLVQHEATWLIYLTIDANTTKACMMSVKPELNFLLRHLSVLDVSASAVLAVKGSKCHVESTRKFNSPPQFLYVRCSCDTFLSKLSCSSVSN